MPIFEWGEWLRLESFSGQLIQVEPTVVLDEFASALWWTVELTEWPEKMIVFLEHHEGRGRFELTVK